MDALACNDHRTSSATTQVGNHVKSLLRRKLTDLGVDPISSIYGPLAIVSNGRKTPKPE